VNWEKIREQNKLVESKVRQYIYISSETMMNTILLISKHVFVNTEQLIKNIKSLFVLNIYIIHCYFKNLFSNVYLQNVTFSKYFNRAQFINKQ
jgi:uncharacterized membrane protein (GlpM family)